MSHSYRELYYHLVWSTKYWLPVINGDIKKELLHYLKDKAIKLGCQVFEINAVSNHVHMLLYIPPDLAVAVVVKRLKGSSSHEIGKGLQNFSWQEGYGVITFRKSDLETVQNYIRNQERHHGEDSIEESLEEVRG